MAQLPSLAHLDLGVPTAVNRKKQSKEAREKEKRKSGQRNMFNEAVRYLLVHGRMVVPLTDMINDELRALKMDKNQSVDDRLGVEYIAEFLKCFVRTYLVQFDGLLGPDREWGDGEQWRFFGTTAIEISRGWEPRDPRLEPLKWGPDIYSEMDDHSSRIASLMYNRYLKMNVENPEKIYHSADEIVDWIEEPRVSLLHAAVMAALDDYKKKYAVEWEPFQARVHRHFQALDLLRELRAGIVERAAAHINSAAVAPRPSPASSEPKSRAEYDRLVQLNKEREEKEEAARLAEQAERDARLARVRDEAAAAAEREEQEREDALVRRLQNASLAGSSRDHADERPLSPGSAAKQLADEQEALEAKQRDIEASREKIRVQLVEKKKRLAEQAERVRQQEHAQRVANVYDHAAAAPKKEGQGPFSK